MSKFIVVWLLFIKCCLNFEVLQLAGESPDVPDDELPVPGHSGDGAYTLLPAIVDPELRYL